LEDDSMAKASNVFVFFNCDGDKNESSMNVFYNNKVYKDTKTSRKVLLKKVMEELEAKRQERFGRREVRCNEK